jgi:Rad3-related DNA helicase
VLLDGKKPAKQNQIQLIQQIQVALSKYDVVGVNAPPGWGKTYISRAIQLQQPRCDIIVSSNHLMDQMTRDYPELAAAKGKANYETAKDYQTARRVAGTAAHAIFNPMSALFTVPREGRKVALTIIDEAHTLSEVLRNAATNTFDTNKAGIPATCKTEYDLIMWAKDRFNKLQQKFIAGELSPAMVTQFEQIGMIYYSVVGQEMRSIFKISRGGRVVRGRSVETLSVTALECPQGILNRLYGDGKVLLLSGSLTRTETELLAAGRSFTWLSVPYLAPPENRPVYIRAVPRELRRDIPTLANMIRTIYTENNMAPTLVHATYADQTLLAQALADLTPITNSPTTKLKAEKKFKADGGIWIAAGCSEGVDLPYDDCEVVILPTLQFPNKGDLYVQKRLGQPGGARWYAIKTLENTVQRLGRGMRGHDDYCKHFIIDPYFPQLWAEYKQEFEPLNVVWGQE